MESQLKHPQQDTNLDTEEHHEHGEKQSVLMKVKAKARKIKDSFKKRGHHEHDDQLHENRPELDEEDEDDDEDEFEEMEKDPEVHSAPIHESQVARNPNVGLGGNQGMMHQEPNMERTDEPAVDNTRVGVPMSYGLDAHHQPNMERIDEPAVGKDHIWLGVPTSHGLFDNNQSNLESINEPVAGKDHTRLGVPTSHGPEGVGTELEKIPERTDEPAVGKDHKDHTRLGVPTSHGPEGVGTELEKIPGMSLEEDLGAPKQTFNRAPRPGNYETKVSDPTGAGAEETPGIGPLLHSLDKMSLDKPATGRHNQDESLGKISADRLAVGSHDQLVSEQPKKYRDMPDDSPLITGAAVEQDMALPDGGYGEKQDYATADKVVAAKDAAAAKLGYGDENLGRADDQTDQTSQTSYTDKASHAAPLLADKAVGVKDVVPSKLGYGGTEEHKTPREPVDHEALMQQSQSGYMQMVSGAASALADKAVEAKNVVTSKLGYGGTEEPQTTREPVDHEALMQQSQSGYMQNVSGVTSPPADKAVEAKNGVASKLGYDQQGDGIESAEPTSPDQTGASTIAQKAAQVKNAEASKLGYGVEGGTPTETSTWAEKLKPGEEDKALSELISSSVYRGSPHGDDISDQQIKSLSKVTESDEVAQRFGTSEEEKRGDLTHIPESESPRKTVVEKIKLAVTSFWSSGDETIPHPETSEMSNQLDADQPSAGARRLEESGNETIPQPETSEMSNQLDADQPSAGARRLEESGN